MESILNIIKQFISKDLEITIDGEQDNLFVFDWQKLETEHDAVFSKAKGMDEDELSDYISSNETEVMQITDYFMDEDCEEKVSNKEWLPFGLLGLCHNPDSFAEMSNNGLLLFDLTKENMDNPPVILYRDNEAQTLAGRFADLEISKAEE